MGFFETVWRDLRFAVRVLSKSPGLTAVALLSLALGIGAASAIFSVVYGVLITPYPYARTNEIWAFEIRSAKDTRQARGNHRLSEYRELEKLPAFQATMATLPESQLLTGEHAPENFTAINVTGSAFDFLGVEPVLGRTITPSDVTEAVIVLSFRAWQRLFDGKPEALGKTLVLNDRRYTVIGVMPPRFGWWTGDGGWIPLAPDTPGDRMVAAIARLRPGVSKATAQQQLHALHQRLAEQIPANFPREGFTTGLRNYMDMTVASGEMQSSLQLLSGAVGFLLLIACANVANLQMARATARAREIALRLSVGAGRDRILRQLLTESMVLSVAGGLLGILLAVGLTRGIVALMPEFYVPNEARITINWTVLAFSAAVSVLTGILFGMAPALQCSRLDLVETLKEAGRGGESSGRAGKARNILVVTEVALSVVLLVGAGLTVHGFVNLQATATGFQADRVLMLGLQLPPKRYATYEQRVSFTEQVLERVKNLPGVQAAAVGNGGLPFGGPQSGYLLEGKPKADGDRLLVGLISADYARTMGIALKSGRNLTDQEVARGERVALINEAAAKLWPEGQNALGQRVRLELLERPPGGMPVPPSQPGGSVTVVGVLANTRNAGLRSPTRPSVFIPYTALAPPGRSLAVRTAGSPMAMLNAVRRAVREIDKDQPLGRPVTLEEVLGSESVQPRFNMALFVFFGALGLTLAGVGLFSLLSYMVARRTHEIGVRMALGAGRGSVARLMLAAGGRLVLAGLGLGLAGALALGKLLRSEVFVVPVADPWSLAGVVAVLCITAVAACVVPARRAAKLDPMAALRHE